MYYRLLDYYTKLVNLLVSKYKIPYHIATIMVSDLEWYTDTGRASVNWCNHLLKAKPFMVYRRILKGGSTNEVIARVTEYIMEVE